MLGICNGFQVLLEAGLLPGAMLRNRDLKFHCEHVARPRRADRHAVHAALRRAGQVLRCRSRTAKATTSPTPDVHRARSKRTARSSSATPTPRGEVDRRGQSERLAQQHRRHLQRGAQRRRPDAASRARLRAGARQRRRPGRVRVGRSTRARPSERSLAARDRHDEPIRSATVLERHGLTPDEYDRIVELLGREPNLTELGIFSVMWSEHCSYKSSRVHLKTLPTDGPARAAGPGRERRRRRHRRRPGRGLQDRVAQPSVVHRAVPGRGDRRRRHHPRHLHDGRAADRAAELAALRLARRPDGARTRRIVEGVVAGIGGYGNSIGIPTVGGEIVFDEIVRGQSAGQRLLPRHREGRRDRQGRRDGRRQPRLLRRRQDRPRRHPRRDDGVGGVRRQVGREAPGRAGRRSVHGEAAARGVPRGDADRRARRRPGHGRGRASPARPARWARAAASASRSTSRSCRSARPA